MKNVLKTGLFGMTLVIFSLCSMHITESANNVTAYAEIEPFALAHIRQDLYFESNDAISDWIHSIGGPDSNKFVPLRSGKYEVFVDGNVKNLTEKAQSINFNIRVNGSVDPVGSYSINLAPNESKEFTYSFRVNLKASDEIKFQMSASSDLIRLINKLEATENSNLKIGESMRVTMQLIDAVPLRDLSVSAVAKKIKKGELTLQRAKELLPPDLHEELETAVSR